MITNHLLIKLKTQNLTDAEKAKAHLLGMKGKIGVLAGIQVELDIRHSAASYDLLLITRFATMEDMEVYLAHPVHLEVSKYIAEVMEASASVCFEE
ncbi:Stress responsive A/B Barrel Domain protein [compost metagenome]